MEYPKISAEKMKRFKTLGILLFLAVTIVLLAWLTISVTYNARRRTLIEQFTVPLENSMVWYGMAVMVIFITALTGTVINRKRKKNENFLGFLYFLFFSILLVIMYLNVFYF